VALNTPFAGCYVPSDRWQTDPRVTSLMVEIRRDRYMTEPGGAYHEGLARLSAELTTLINTI
jgi:N-formylglutamate deformylase